MWIHTIIMIDMYKFQKFNIVRDCIIILNLIKKHSMCSIIMYFSMHNNISVPGTYHVTMKAQ